MRFKIAAMALACALLPATVGAQHPRESVPWLSDSIRIPDYYAPATTGPMRFDSRIGADFTGRIQVQPLPRINQDTVGLISPRAAGLRHDLWGTTSPFKARFLIRRVRNTGLSATRELFHTLLLAETAPPRIWTRTPTILRARIDALLDMGAVDEAEALLERAGPLDRFMFRRQFDIGLLTGREDQVCEKIRINPGYAPTLPARVFCSARAGDWDVAVVTLGIGKRTDEIDATMVAQLEWFLEPGFVDEENPIAAPDTPTAMDFVLREAIGLQRPDKLPLAFMYRDLIGDHTPRARVYSAEQLSRYGALPVPILMAAYRAVTPSASGGIWDRIDVIQKIDAALMREEDALPLIAQADEMFAPLGLRRALARAYGAYLAESTPDPDYADTVAALLWLTKDRNAAMRWSALADDPELQTLAQLYSSRGITAPISQDRPMEKAMQEAFLPLQTLSGRFPKMERLKAQDKPAELILNAIHLLDAGADISPEDFTQALYALRLAGQEERAKLIAVEVLLQP